MNWYAEPASREPTSQDAISFVSRGATQRQSAEGIIVASPLAGP
jgi:hypothetical protein